MGGRIQEITTKGGLYDAFMLYDLNDSRIEKRGIRQNAAGECIRHFISYRYDCSGRLLKEERTEKEAVPQTQYREAAMPTT